MKLLELMRELWQLTYLGSFCNLVTFVCNSYEGAAAIRAASKKAEQISIEQSPPAATPSTSKAVESTAACKVTLVRVKDDGRTSASQLTAAADTAAGKTKTIAVKDSTQASASPPPKKTKRVY